MERLTRFIDVIVPLAVPNLYTYRVPHELNDLVQPGQRVVIRFGKNKLYSALIRRIHERAPNKYEAKYFESILDEQPIVNEKQFGLWEWISEYYMCTIGEVMNAALPGGLKLASEARIILAERSTTTSEPVVEQAADNQPLLPYEENTITVHDKYSGLSDKEFLIVDALELRKVLTISEASLILEQKTVYPVIKSLIEKGVVVLEEELKEKYKPRLETFVQLTGYANEEKNLEKIFNELEKKAHKQLEMVMAFVKVSGRYDSENRTDLTIVKKSILLKACNGDDATLKALVKKNIFELSEKETGRLKNYEGINQVKSLDENQQRAFDKVKDEFKSKDVVLLHGVTSSGKTEIYVKLIEDTIKQGKQVLYLLPEIALTTQIIHRLQKYFGNKVGVYHSRFNENERVEIWNRIIKNEKPKNSEDFSYSIILGARSALFLPFSNLGLIIVDEEHDTSYKQHEPAPRYNARDSAIFLACLHKAKTLLGSATPAIDTYYNALQQKFGLVELTERFGGVQMPEIIITDVKEAKRKKMMKSHLSPVLLDTIKLALDNQEQVILFQNRRGFAPMLECNACAWTPQCKNCDVSLTYHKGINLLRCHYCGYSSKPPTICEACGSTEVIMKGFGTEKIEEELALFFPEARVARMDLDTTRSKYAYHQIISDFEERNIHILVGTQMVTKGLDFDNVSVVGILNADSMMSYPDFRSHERAFQLMAQVSGRAGRKNKRGKVVIQTHNPGHNIIKDVIENNYLGMYNAELAERKTVEFPPFFRLIRFTLRHKDIDLLNHVSDELGKKLREKFGKAVLGPEFPTISKIRNNYLKNILIKIPREAAVVQIKKNITALLTEFALNKDFKPVQIIPDVDPV